MTQKEFEDRTGLSVSAEKFEQIHELYMLADDLDKDLFCKDYFIHSESLIIGNLTKLLKDRNWECAANKCEKIVMAEFLIDQAQKWSAGDLNEKAIQMIGAKEYLKLKICKGYNLWESDKELIVELL